MLTIQNFGNHQDPFMALFQHSLKNLSVHEVVTILEKMDRYDIIDDTQSLLGKYASNFWYYYFVCFY